jgi:3-oxoacyl-[acyl-carrier protein] reductase
MRYLLAEGFTRFIELGPGTALSGFMKRIDPGVQMLNVADAASLEATVRALAAEATAPTVLTSHDEPTTSIGSMNQLASQVAVVTGAGRGIGRAIALRFAAAGADVVCVSRTVENAEKAAAEVRALGRRAWAHAVDVADPAAVAASATAILAEAGRVDILVNNAGVTRDGLLMRMSEEDWDTVLNTNLRGAFAFTKAFTRTFVKQRSGRIINVASVSGLIGNAGQCNYAASKAGLIGFTKSLARELASRGITVNALAPGFITTDMTAGLTEELKAGVLRQIPLGRFGEAEDIAQAALFLAGPGARYVTGQVLAVDGGMAM